MSTAEILDITDPRTAAATYVDLIFGGSDGWVAIGIGLKPFYKDTGKYAHEKWIEKKYRWPAERDKMLSECLSAGGDVYIVPAIRATKARTKNTAGPAHWAWADYDEEWTDEVAALADHPGFAVVSSGRGAHIYAALPELADNANDLDIWNRRLAAHFGDGADSKWKDNSFLRLPGTYSYKLVPKGGEPIPVRWHQLPQPGSVDLHELLPDDPQHGRQATANNYSSGHTPDDLDTSKLPPFLRRIFDIAPTPYVEGQPDHSRSGLHFAVVANAVEWGYTDRQVHEIVRGHGPSVDKFGDRLTEATDDAIAKVAHKRGDGKRAADAKQREANERLTARKVRTINTDPGDDGDSDSGDTGNHDGGDGDPAPKPHLVVNNRELGDLRDETLKAIDAANQAEPELFLRSGVIVNVTADENGRALIIPTSKAAMRNHATDAAVFKTETVRSKEGESYVVENYVSPPNDVVESILALPSGKLPFPALVALTEAPIIRPDGTIRTETGYDPATKLYYLPSEPIAMPPVPEHPNRQQIDLARDIINDLLVDFPFVDNASRANAFGMIVGAVVRSAVDGSAPLAVVDATAPGTGKSLLTDMAAVIATGRPAAFISWPGDEDEARKMLTAAFAGGTTLMPLDNVEGALRSPKLASALTAKDWQDRMLGQTTQLKLPVRCSWIVNGNGVTLKGDLPRRAFWIRMEAATNRPWTRKGFRHPNLIEHVRNHRGDILAAILTMARAWYAAGKPAPKVNPIGSFEEWTRMVAGILETAGVADFLGNADELYETNNHDEEEWVAFLTAIRHAEFLNGEFTAGDVADKLISAPITWRDCTPTEIAIHLGKNSTAIAKAIGEAFNSRAGRRWDEQGMRLARAQKIGPDGKRTDKKNRLKSQIWTISYDVTADDL